MISKIHTYKDVGYNTYSKLFNSCVAPVIDYCSGVWGFEQFNKIDTVQNTPYRFTVRQKKREVAASSGVAHF